MEPNQQRGTTAGQMPDREPPRPSCIPAVLHQHLDDVGDVWNARRPLATGGVRLAALARFDDRIAANLDGCVAAGGGGDAIELALQQLSEPNVSGTFAALLLSLQVGDHVAFEKALEVARQLRAGFVAASAAVEWAEPPRLAGLVRNLLKDGDAWRQALGLAACRVHGVDPGSRLTVAMHSDEPMIRVEALRAAGEIGRVDQLAACRDRMAVEGEEQFWAARSALFLGDRRDAIDVLVAAAGQPALIDEAALSVALQAMTPPRAHDTLRSLVNRQDGRRRMIRGSGLAGDPAVVGWLIKRMSDEKQARLAGEAFTLITGTDLVDSALDRTAPGDFEAGPNDAQDDPDVDLDPDDGVPWPEAAGVEAWWAANRHRYRDGERYFMGAPVTREHCIDVLKSGYQRQRILAAHYLCLLNPGTPLFNTSAPAWRQQRLLAQM